MAILDNINQIDNRLREIRENVAPALSNLKNKMSENSLYFKRAILSENNFKLSFEFYSIKIEITSHINLNTVIPSITQGILKTSIFDDSQQKYIHKPNYDIIIDRLGNIDNAFDKDDWYEHYFEKVIWDLYLTSTEITLK